MQGTVYDCCVDNSHITLFSESSFGIYLMDFANSGVNGMLTISVQINGLQLI